MDTIIEGCPACGRRLRIPLLRGPLALTCPACRGRWDWAPPASLTDFVPDSARLAPFRPCMDCFEGANPASEWPQNILSRRMIVFGSGRIAREGDAIRHDVDPAELALCRRLADEARGLLQGKVDGGLGSEGHLPFDAFSIVANRDEPAPARIDEELIRSRFGGTIYPAATIDVQPLVEGARWWSDVLMCAEETADVQAMLGVDDEDEEDPAPYFEAFVSVWREAIRWFREAPEFVDAAFVAIGNYDRLTELTLGSGPPPDGMAGRPSAYPRLFVGLTRGGSLAGIITHVVQT